MMWIIRTILISCFVFNETGEGGGVARLDIGGIPQRALGAREGGGQQLLGIERARHRQSAVPSADRIDRVDSLRIGGASVSHPLVLPGAAHRSAAGRGGRVIPPPWLEIRLTR